MFCIQDCDFWFFENPKVYKRSTENNPESPIVDFINHSENPNGVIKITSEKIYFQSTETIQAKDSNSDKF